MNINKVFVATVIILLVAFFSSSRGEVTGQASAIKKADIDGPQNIFPRYVEVAPGQTFMMHIAGGAYSYDPVRFDSYDVSQRVLQFSTLSRIKQITTSVTSTNPFLGQGDGTLVLNGETMGMTVNDGQNYPDGLPRIYLRSYINEDKIIHVGENIVFSQTNLCQAMNCYPQYKSHPMVWRLISIDSVSATFQDLFVGGTKQFLVGNMMPL